MTRKIWIVHILLLLVYLLFFIYVDKNLNYGGDERKYHLPQIEYFETVGFNFGDTYTGYAPMTPGHHIFLSWIAFIDGSANNIIMRFVHALFTFILVFAVWRFYYQQSDNDVTLAFILLLPFYFSHYTISGMIWIGTDNSSLLWVFFALYFLLKPPSISNLSWASLFTCLAILWRQVHLWLMVPLFIQCYLFKIDKKKVWTVNLVIIPTICAFYFFLLWEGFMPANWQKKSSLFVGQNGYIVFYGFVLFLVFMFVSKNLEILYSKWISWNKKYCEKYSYFYLYVFLFLLFSFVDVFSRFASLQSRTCFIYIFSLFGGLSCFYFCCISKRVFDVVKKDYMVLLFITVLSIIFIIFTPQAYFYQRNITGGILWSLSFKIPQLGNHSLLFWALSVMGSISFYLWWRLMGSQKYLIYISLFFWILAHCQSANVWQRYYEPFLLLILGVMFVFSLEKDTQKKVNYTSVISLSTLLFIGSCLRFFL